MSKLGDAIKKFLNIEVIPDEPSFVEEPEVDLEPWLLSVVPIDPRESYDVYYFFDTSLNNGCLIVEFWKNVEDIGNHDLLDWVMYAPGTWTRCFTWNGYKPGDQPVSE